MTILELIILARKAPELIAAVAQLVRDGQDPSPEFISEWEAKLQASVDERNRLIDEAQARLNAGGQP